MPGARKSKPSIKKATARLVRQKIEAGLADLQAGRKHDHASICKEVGLA